MLYSHTHARARACAYIENIRGIVIELARGIKRFYRRKQTLERSREIRFESNLKSRLSSRPEIRYRYPIQNIKYEKRSTQRIMQQRKSAVIVLTGSIIPTVDRRHSRR